MQKGERQTYCIASGELLNAARIPASHDSQTPIVQGLPLTFLHVFNWLAITLYIISHNIFKINTFFYSNDDVASNSRRYIDTSIHLRARVKPSGL